MNRTVKHRITGDFFVDFFSAEISKFFCKKFSLIGKNFTWKIQEKKVNAKIFDSQNIVALWVLDFQGGGSPLSLLWNLVRDPLGLWGALLKNLKLLCVSINFE